MASGIGTSEECVQVINSMRKAKNLSFLIFKIENNEVVVDQTGKRGESDWDDFFAIMEQAEKDGKARYALYDTKDSKKKDILVFITFPVLLIRVDYGRNLHGVQHGVTALLHVLPREWLQYRFLHSLASGVQVRDDCKTEYETMKLRHNYSYIIYKISGDNKYIEIADLGQPGASYDSFVKKLEEAGNQNEGRYAVFDANIADKKNVLVFFMWIPDNQVSIRQKMLYTSSKRAIRDKLQGIAKELQCNDAEDLAWSALVEKCQSKYD